ncbi:MAG: hypothetical protein KDD02_13575 [Phaeodactylibacter sp.]|nr:hypothetical protein [Phaeodactylibacter sp.]MCB9299981.1 hypothetical protein [Lewinellaceae bacterium]HQU61256.1 hypothetical protein [Saprospiraceae bacterium]
MKLETISFQTPKGWRDWLAAHHSDSPGIWMLFYKKHTGQACITYAEALEEALCYGWIDSIKKRRDGSCKP